MGPLLGKAALFFFVVMPLAFWVLPWALRRASAFRSRELFALAVITLALTMAGGASLLGVSLALGAFLTGVFFVSIGMLLDPRFLLDSWALVLLTVAMIVLVKGAVTTAIARFLGCSTRSAVAAHLLQTMRKPVGRPLPVCQRSG